MFFVPVLRTDGGNRVPHIYDARRQLCSNGFGNVFCIMFRWRFYGCVVRAVSCAHLSARDINGPSVKQRPEQRAINGCCLFYKKLLL